MALDKKMKSMALLLSILTAIVILLTNPQNILAAPSISGVTGTFTNGGEITIIGSGFGGKDNATPLISSYDNPVSSNNWNTGSIGSNWNVIGSVSITGSNPRTNFYQSANKVRYDADGAYANIGYNRHTDDDKIYVSWWMYRDYTDWRGNASGGGNSKFFRIYTNSAGGDSVVLSLWWDNSNLQYAYGQAEYAPSCPGWQLSYTGTSATKGASSYWRVNFGDSGRPQLRVWEHYEVVVDYPDSPGQANASITLWKDGQTVWRCTGIAIDTTSSLDNERLIRIGQVSGGRTESQIEYLDQVYIDNSVAHVFLSDSPNVDWPDSASVYHSEVQVCSSWSDSSITCTLNQGSFSSGQTVYLYVVNAQGEINSPGHPIVIGGGSSGDNPPVGTITSPVNQDTYQTSNDAVSLAGTASDDNGISSVTWTNSRGGSGAANNDSGDWTSWSVANIPLQKGENVITVTATDTAGQTATDTLTITYSPPADTTPPTVQITGPTSNETYDTTSSTINLVGTANDNVAVSEVTWQNSAGGSGTASGTTSWTINNITLQEGENVITVTAADGSGNTGTDTITITYTVPQGTYTKTFGDSSDADYTGTVQDTFLNLNNDVNVSSTSLNTYTWPTDKPANAIVMKWDLSAIPAGAQIQSATLYLYMNSMEVGGGDELYDVSVHKIINHNPDLAHCNGYTYDGTHNWTANNICYKNVPLAQADIAPAEDTKSLDKTYGYKTWNVTNMVKDWISNPSTNYGLLLNSDSSASSDSNRFFASSEAPDPSQRPKLVITYTVGDDTTPPGDVTNLQAVPGPAKVTFSWTNPTDSDFAGVMIRYRTDGTYPQDMNDGYAVPNGNDGKIAGNPGQAMSYVHDNLDPTKYYYYSFFTYDTAGNYSHTAHASAQPLPPSGSGNQAPVISSFTAVPNPANNPHQKIDFAVQASDPDGDALSYTIVFGDGSSSNSGSTVTHAYSTKGTYTAQATVSDNQGHSVSKSIQVTVNDAKPARVKSVKVQ